jgi:hypothetical protein
MSVLRGGSHKMAVWLLVHLDGLRRGSIIDGQYACEGYTERLGAAWAEVPLPQRAPAWQWTRAEAEGATFTARFWAPNATLIERQRILDRVAALREAVRSDPTLGRPPRMRFTWGALGYDCVVAGVGDLRYEELWSDGSPKAVTCRVELIRYADPPALEPTDLAAPEHLSRYRPMLEGGTYETMALKEWDNPSLGVLLRQENDLAFPPAGTIVRCPAADHFTGKALRPVAYALSDAEPAVAARNALLDARGGAVEVAYL